MTEQDHTPPPMQLTRDFTHKFVGLQGIGSSVCRIRTYELPAATPVVIATQLSGTENSSVTSAAEYIAAEVLTRFFRERLEEDEPVIWIEHYDAPRLHGRVGKPEYSRVRFSTWSPRVETKFSAGDTTQRIRFGEPEWDDLTQADIERLIGHSLDEGPPSKPAQNPGGRGE